VEYEPNPRRAPGALTRILRQLSPGVRDVDDQREPFARYWDEQNATALAEDGPLWVVIGDSTSQGIGANHPSESWVPLILDRLRDQNPKWRVINLSITGGQYSDVTSGLLPRYREIVASEGTPELATLFVGSNNLMAPVSWPSMIRHLKEILQELPPNAVIANVGTESATNSTQARRINRAIKRAPHQPVHTFWPWSWPSRDGQAADRYHPNTVGYGYVADLVWPKILDALAAT